MQFLLSAAQAVEEDNNKDIFIDKKRVLCVCVSVPTQTQTRKKTEQLLLL